MNELINLSRTVTEILTDYPVTRVNDNELVRLTMRSLGIDTSLPLETLASMGCLYLIPSIVRTRRKVQQAFPELETSTTAQRRHNHAEIFKEYSHLDLKEVL